jgi:hypothetical protein
MAYQLSEGEIGLIGVGLGFALSFGADLIRARRRLKRLCAALRSEIGANLRIVQQKRDILRQVEDLLPKNRLLSPSGVRFASQVYLAHFPELAAHYSELSRNSLHVIYDSQRIFDDTCEALDRQLNASAYKEDLAAVTAAVIMKLPDLKNLLSSLDIQLSAHLAGKPVDVLHLALPLDEIRKKYEA